MIDPKKTQVLFIPQDETKPAYIIEVDTTLGFSANELFYEKVLGGVVVHSHYDPPLSDQGTVRRTFHVNYVLYKGDAKDDADKENYNHRAMSVLLGHRFEEGTPKIHSDHLVYGDCILLQENITPRSMMLRGEPKYAGVHKEDIRYYTENYGPLRPKAEPKFNVTDEQKKMLSEFFQSRMEYFEGPEPNPYDGTYSEE